MRIGVARSGGFAGLRSRRDLDTGALSVAGREQLERLVAAARLFELPRALTRGMPDVIRYHITIERGGAVHDVMVDDDLADPALLALIEFVLGDPGSP